MGYQIKNRIRNVALVDFAAKNCRQCVVVGMVFLAVALPSFAMADDLAPLIGAEGATKKPFFLISPQPKTETPKIDALEVANKALMEVENRPVAKEAVQTFVTPPANQPVVVKAAAKAPEEDQGGFVTGRAMSPKSIKPTRPAKKDLLVSEFDVNTVAPPLDQPQISELRPTIPPIDVAPAAATIVAPELKVETPKPVDGRLVKQQEPVLTAPDAQLEVVVTLPNGRAPVTETEAEGGASVVANGDASRPSQMALIDASEVQPTLAKTPETAEQLSKAVFNALETHPLVKGRKATAQARDHEVRAERSAYYPLVSVDAYTGWHDTKNDATKTASGDDSVDRWESEGEIRARQLVWDFGVTDSRVDAAKSREAEAGADIQDGQEEIALRAAEAYLDVIRALENLEFARHNVAKHEKTLRDVNLKEQAGAGDGGDVAQTESRLALARAFQIQFEEVLENAESRFREAVGYSPAELTRPQLPDLAVPSTVDEAILDANRFNNSLRSAAYRVEAFGHDADAEYDRLFPRLDIDISQSRGTDVETFGGISEDTRALLRLSWDFPTGGEKFARRDRASNLRLAAAERMHERQRETEQRVRISYSDVQKSTERLVPLKDRVAASDAVVDAYQKQFEAGRRTLLDTLDAENERFLAKVAYNDGEYENLRAHYRLFSAAGRLREALGVTR